ncbi:M20 family peptidase [Larkinella humicola]|uniref:M20/M25/M40 family metallo-hydrolase n=1 Tax=Larkinella humicola TaxID=2607654 RepID=A0A5N1JEC4_9BACT|nr:M20 family peptidase [Larkinella humicola]KAA9353726.1 M20/M25/M40 family metallo-hydrolase [Larkinella humicola]
MKRLRWLLIGLAVLLLVLLVNTLRFSSKQLSDVPPAASVSVGDSAVNRLVAALRLRTVSYSDESLTDTTQFDQFLSLLQQSFPRIHQQLKRETFNQYGLLYEWKGKNPALKPVLLTGHYDVVPVIQGTQKMWKRPPFDGLLEGGFLYGRGTLDDKSSVMAQLEAVEGLLATGFQPERTIMLAYGQDEEVTGFRGAQTMAAELERRKITLEYVLDEGGVIKTDGIPGLPRPVALIGIGEKGYASIELTTVSKGGHSSMPPKQTSIGLVAEAVSKLEKNPFPARLDAGLDQMFTYIGPEMPFGQRIVFANQWLFAPLITRIMAQSNSGNATLRTTTAPTIFQAGVKDNVLPIEATATINFRILPGETVETVAERVKEVIDDERIQVNVLKKFISQPSPVSNPNALGFERIHRTIKGVYPETIVTPYLTLGGTDSRFYARVCPQIYRFSPTPMNDEDTQRVHGTNERISLKDYRNMIRFYATLIRNSQN